MRSTSRFFMLSVLGTTVAALAVGLSVVVVCPALGAWIFPEGRPSDFITWGTAVKSLCCHLVMVHLGFGLVGLVWGRSFGPSPLGDSVATTSPVAMWMGFGVAFVAFHNSPYEFLSVAAWMLFGVAGPLVGGLALYAGSRIVGVHRSSRAG